MPNISLKTGEPKIEPKGELLNWFNMYNDRSEIGSGNAMAGLSANDNRAQAGGTAAWGDPIVENRTRWDSKYNKEEEGGFNPLGQLDGLDLRRKIARDNEIARQQVEAAAGRSIKPVAPKSNAPDIKRAPPRTAATAPGVSVSAWGKGKEVPPGGSGGPRTFELLQKEAEDKPPPPPPPPPQPTELQRQMSLAQREWRMAADAMWNHKLEALQNEAEKAAQQERMALNAFEAFAMQKNIRGTGPADGPVSFPSLPRMSDKPSSTYVSRYEPAVPMMPLEPPPPPPQETRQPMSPPPQPMYGGPRPDRWPPRCRPLRHPDEWPDDASQPALRPKGSGGAAAATQG